MAAAVDLDCLIAATSITVVKREPPYESWAKVDQLP